jgi:hypothetical protein
MDNMSLRVTERCFCRFCGSSLALGESLEKQARLERELRDWMKHAQVHTISHHWKMR